MEERPSVLGAWSPAPRGWDAQFVGEDLDQGFGSHRNHSLLRPKVNDNTATHLGYCQLAGVMIEGKGTSYVNSS